MGHIPAPTDMTINDALSRIVTTQSAISERLGTLVTHYVSQDPGEDQEIVLQLITSLVTQVGALATITTTLAAHLDQLDAAIDFESLPKGKDLAVQGGPFTLAQMRRLLGGDQQV